MQTEYKAIVQVEHGAPEKVLSISKRPLEIDRLGADEALVRVIASPIHVGDVHILEALPQGGPVAPIPEGTTRTPGFEGVGTIVRLGTSARAAKRVIEGQRVAFFPANGSWAEYVVVKQDSLLPIPKDIPDQVAAQILINTITASILIKTGHNSLKPPVTLPVYIIQNAAGRWTFAYTNRFGSWCSPHSFGEVCSVRRKAKFGASWATRYFNQR